MKQPLRYLCKFHKPKASSPPTTTAHIKEESKHGDIVLISNPNDEYDSEDDDDYASEQQQYDEGGFQFEHQESFDVMSEAKLYKEVKVRQKVSRRHKKQVTMHVIKKKVALNIEEQRKLLDKMLIK